MMVRSCILNTKQKKLNENMLHGQVINYRNFQSFLSRSQFTKNLIKLTGLFYFLHAMQLIHSNNIRQNLNGSLSRGLGRTTWKNL